MQETAAGPLDTRGDLGFEGRLGAVLVRNGKPVAGFDLDSWGMSRHPVARVLRALTFWRKRA